jgi:CO/xanthine dehydrogenase FAD-binding subunit
MRDLFRPTEFVSAATVREALLLLEERGQDAKVVAGGTDLMVRRPPCRTLLDITRLGWSYVRNEDALRIGATTPLSDVLEACAADDRLEALSECLRSIGSIAIRNMATLGGNLCKGAAPADAVPVLIALDARVRIAGLRGEREASVEDFTSSEAGAGLGRGELLAEVVVATQPRGSGAAFLKLTRHHASDDIAVASVAARVALDDAGRCADARICLGAAVPSPTRAVRAERSLLGTTLGDGSIDAAARIAMEEGRVVGNHRGSAGYKREMVRVLVKKAVGEALARAGERKDR